MSYEKLDIYSFGQHLLTSKDIDPVYCLLEKSGWSNELKARWCLAYWCTYHVGVASYVAGTMGQAYWDVLTQVAANETPAPTGGRWPRGKERRHWRGAQAAKSLDDLMKRYGKDPAGFLFMVGNEREFVLDPIPYKVVADRVKDHVGFGPWMAFKIADMLEQVFHVPVNFDNVAVFMFKDPQEAALKFWRATMGLPEKAQPRDRDRVINEVVAHLQERFRGFEAPNGKRSVGLQEIETILCKWKSHMNGHYPLNNDINEIWHAAKEWTPHSVLARTFMEHVAQ